MECKHCGKDSDELTREESDKEYLNERLEEEKLNPDAFRRSQEKVYKDALARGCFFWNHTPKRIAIFEPWGGGSYGDIYGELADEIWQELLDIKRID